MAKEDWSWKPPAGYDKKPARERPMRKKEKRKRNKAEYRRYSEAARSMGPEFYKSREWRQLRYKVIVKHEAKCMACGRSPKEHGIVIHVDHIKPRNTHPALALRQSNLQLLCEDCNLGKGCHDRTDWLPDDTQAKLDEMHLEAIRHLI